MEYRPEGVLVVMSHQKKRQLLRPTSTFFSTISPLKRTFLAQVLGIFLRIRIQILHSDSDSIIPLCVCVRRSENR